MTARILAGIGALALTPFALLALGSQFRGRFDPMGAIFAAWAVTMAAYGWWFALRGHVAESRRRMRFALTGGLLLGGIGFILGFFGPIVLKPDANQGPLLGIFVTGPLGFVLGSGLGWIFARGGTVAMTANRETRHP
ncbi:MAG TPA: hypothetical protein VFS09_06765 [Candidatus Eisenbacteria bacterium]|nr:hypothetical protein [Candidatus Eisenbacteria bacterium]